MTPTESPPASGPTAVVAEDEAVLADELCEHLAALWPVLRIAARAADGVAALHAVETHEPAIAFLDIHMPRLSGLDVARQIRGRCHVVFITAYDSHAVAAFEAGAIDYVLKPINPGRLVTTVQRLKTRLEGPPRDLDSALRRLAQLGTSAPRRHLQWINAMHGATVRLITVEEILYFKADSKYTLVVTPDSESLIRKTIRQLGEELDPSMFWQVHRSCIVNVHAIAAVVRDDRGAMTLRLKNRKDELPVSEPYHHLFRQM